MGPCPQCGAGIEVINTPALHIDTKEESTAKFKADPEVKEYLEGIKADTKADMKEKASGKKHK